MILIALGMLLGCSTLLFLPVLPPVWSLLFGLLICTGWYLYFHIRRLQRSAEKLYEAGSRIQASKDGFTAGFEAPTATSCMLSSILIILLSFTYGVWTAQHRLAWQLPLDSQDQIVTIQGMVSSVPERDDIHTSFYFTLQQLNNQPEPNPKVRLNWYSAPDQLQVGQVWRLQAKLRRIHGLANSGGFDYEEYALENNFQTTGEVVSSKQNQLVSNMWYHHPIDRIRQRLANNIQMILGTSAYTPMITALVVGVKQGLTPEQWQVLQRTGTNHLLVIAGLHIGMLSGLVYWLASWCWRRSQRLVLVLPAPDVGAMAALMIAIIYAALAGFSVPTQRALTMIVIFVLIFLRRGNLAVGVSLATALALVLLLDPLAVLSVAFWLSFGAVSLILYGFVGRLNLGNHWWQHARMQWVVSLGVIPLTLLMFQNASFISPLANAIAIPVVGFVVVPFSLLGSGLSVLSLTVGSSLLHAAVWVISVVWTILSALAAVPWFSWQHAVTSPWVMLSLLLATLLMLAPRGWPARYLAIFYLLPTIFSMPPAPAMGTVSFTLLDVGQGLASVVRTAHHVLIFDTGAKFGNMDMGSSVVVPYLRSQGINQIDTLVVSHGDNDHIGGANAILANYPVAQIMSSVPERFLPRVANYCFAQMHWQWDGVEFEFLYPDAEHLGLDNDSSCVLRISAGNQHLLLTGDIEQTAETILLNTVFNQLPATVLVAPHHGSKTSSSAPFVDAVHPQWVLFPVGYLNRYHFPSSEVVQRYQALGAMLLQTDQTGSINLVLVSNQPIMPTWYRQRRRFWYNQSN